MSTLGAKSMEMFGKRRPAVAVFYNALSPDFARELLGDMDRVNFMKGLGGRHQSFIRIATTDDHNNTYFQTGQHIYPAQPASDIECKVIAIVNRMLQMQHDALTKRHELDESNVAFLYSPVNTIQILVELMDGATGYAPHSDCDKMVNTPGMLSDMGGNSDIIVDRLPLREEMQTVTLVVTTFPDSEKTTHTLQYWDSGRHVPGSSLDLTGNCVHWQLHGTQVLEHSVSAVNGVNVNGHIRIVLSCRHTRQTSREDMREIHYGDMVDDIIVSKSRYVYTRLLSFLRKCETPPERERLPDTESVLHEVEFKEKQVFLKLKKELISDTYKGATEQHAERAELHPASGNMIAYPLCAWNFAMRGDVVHQLIFSRGFYPTLQVNVDNDIRSIPCLFRRPTDGSRSGLFFPMDLIDKDIVTRFAGITHTSRNHPPTCGDHTVSNALFLSQPYKNDIFRIRRVLEQHYSPPKPDVFGDITVYGSGGSPTSSGTHAFNVEKATKHDPTSTTPSPQKVFLSKQNRTMMNLSNRMAVVGVFVDYDKFRPFLQPAIVSKIKAPPNSSLFLGYYYFGDTLLRTLSINELKALRDNIQDSLETLKPSERVSFLNYSRFLEEKHLEFTLRPVFATHESLANLKEMSDRNEIREVICTLESPPIRVEMPNDCIWASDPSNEKFTKCFIDGTHCEQMISQTCDTTPATRLNEVESVLHHLILLMVAGSVRYLGRTLETDGGETRCLPICGKTYRLSTGYRGHASPMPVRQLDVTPGNLRECAFELGVLSMGTPWKRSKLKIDTDLFFMAVCASAHLVVTFCVANNE